MKLTQYIFLSVFTVLLLSGCKDRFSEQDIVGIWKVDSAYTYYNGFDNMVLSSAGWAEYEYEIDGKMKEIKEGMFKPFLYEIKADTLIHRHTNGMICNKYKIFELDNGHMVLKKEHPHIFKGPNQERYEIRFFSKKDNKYVDADGTNKDDLR